MLNIFTYCTYTLISQAVFSGMTVSTCIWGYVSDNFGRKKVIYLLYHCRIQLE